MEGAMLFQQLCGRKPWVKNTTMKQHVQKWLNKSIPESIPESITANSWITAAVIGLNENNVCKEYYGTMMLYWCCMRYHVDLLFNALLIDTIYRYCYSEHTSCLVCLQEKHRCFFTSQIETHNNVFLFLNLHSC